MGTWTRLVLGEPGTTQMMPPRCANTWRYARHWNAYGVRVVFASVSGWRTHSRATPRASDSRAVGLKSSTPNPTRATQELRGLGIRPVRVRSSRRASTADTRPLSDPRGHRSDQSAARGTWRCSRRSTRPEECQDSTSRPWAQSACPGSGPPHHARKDRAESRG